MIRRTRELQQQINYHNYRYFALDAPLISDAAYNTLFQELLTLEQTHPELVAPDSPTQRVGAAPSVEFGEVLHPLPMLSLSNAFNGSDLEAWHRRTSSLLETADFGLVCEPKIDGLAISLTYEDNCLIRGATRGDGSRGEDVTANVRTIRSVPLSVFPRNNMPRRFEVRGEVYLAVDGFAYLNEERARRGEPAFANPRNAAAGSLRQLDPGVTAERPLEIFVYQLGWADRGPTPPTHWETLEWLREIGFRVNSRIERATGLPAVAAYHQRWLDERHAVNYATDGIVIKIDRLDYQRHLGSVGREPRWAIAYKFPAERVATRLLDIGLNVGRTGSLNPYAMLEPAQVSGVTVRHAALHNEDDIRRKDIRIGDWVWVERAGEVIPQVIGPLLERRTGAEVEFHMPERCPVCNGPVARERGQALHRCANAGCSTQRYERLRHFATTLRIEGMGEKLIRQLLDAGLVLEPPDFYRLTHGQLASLDRMGEKSAANVLQSIEASKQRPVTSVLAALGIPHVGRETAEILVGHYGNVLRIMDATVEELRAIPGIGPVVATGVARHFAAKASRSILCELASLNPLTRQDTPSSLGRKTLAGLRFVVTGRLQQFTRSSVESHIKNLGGQVANSVSRKTDFLLAGEDPGSKLTDAQQLGVQILTEEEFLSVAERGQ